MDTITIRELELFCNHGVFEEENILGQKFLVSAKLFLDLCPAGEDDELTHSVHYGEVCYMIKDFMEEHTFQLIEAAAEQLARHLLIEIERLEEVELEVCKPWAPIGLPLNNVSVCIRRGWHRAYLSLGSNMGDRLMFLEDAVATLEADPCCHVLDATEWMETEPYGEVEQEDFLNGCVELRTLYDPYKLLSKLHEIENEAGRERKVHWGPRTLDIDILLYDDQVISTKELTVPHADMHNRAFVLEPMAKLAPWKRHPLLHLTMKELLDELNKKRDTERQRDTEYE